MNATSFGAHSFPFDWWKNTTKVQTSHVLMALKGTMRCPGVSAARRRLTHLSARGPAPPAARRICDSSSPQGSASLLGSAEINQTSRQRRFPCVIRTHQEFPKIVTERESVK